VREVVGSIQPFQSKKFVRLLAVDSRALLYLPLLSRMMLSEEGKSMLKNWSIVKWMLVLFIFWFLYKFNSKSK